MYLKFDDFGNRVDVPERGPRRLPRPGTIPRPGIGKTPTYGRPPIERVRPRPLTPPNRRVAPGLLKIAGGVGLGLGIAEWLDDYQFYKNGEPFKVSGGDWYHVHDCGRRPGAPPYGSGGNNNGPYWEIVSGHVINCLGGQVPAGLHVPAGAYSHYHWDYPNGVNHGNETLFLSDSAFTPALRMRHDNVWHRNAGHSGPLELTNWPVSLNPPDPFGGIRNPNVLRQMPSPAPTPWPPPEPVRDPAPDRWIYDNLGPPNAPPRVHRAEPPQPGKKEKKILSRAARVGIFLWRMMDTISELTEIGGAIYKALPEEIRKKADCGSGVNIGQYGSDFNQCMAETLYHNWDQLDGGKAIREIAKNIVEDMTVGMFHRWLSKVTPPGVSLERTLSTHAIAQIGFEAYVAKKLGELFDALGI